jgi:TolB-like protein
MKPLLLILGLFLSLFNSYAQQPAKNDVILKVNGDELVGKIVEIADDAIRFSYQNESLVYAIKKQDILKVTFASGRIEFFNKPSLSSEKKSPTESNTNTSLADHHNKVAILPFGYIKNSQSATDEMGFKAQNDTYSLLSKHSAGLQIIDPRTSNALLIKAGVTRDNLKGYTMDEICNILGVEYVVDGTIIQNLDNSSTRSFGNVRASDGKKNNDKNITGYSSTTSTENFATSVALAIYTDKNESIFNETRKALFNQNEGAYDSPLQYLLKRCPLYRK